MCSIGSISSIGLLGSRGLLQIEPISLVSPPFLFLHHLNGGRTNATEKNIIYPLNHLSYSVAFFVLCLMNEASKYSLSSIEESIYLIRNMHVMLDRDLAIFYQTETRIIKQAVKRNKERFPADFMFELCLEEVAILVSQNVIPDKRQLGGALPYAFTEQGVAMLTTVIKTKTAVEISIQIMRTFVALKKIHRHNSGLFQRVALLERKQLQADEQFQQIFNALEKSEGIPEQGIFFNGQIFDAWVFVAEIIRSATSSIILIDNYIDESTLAILSKRQSGVTAVIYSDNLFPTQVIDLKKLQSQYDSIAIKKLKNNHDRFLVIDRKIMYHIGASLKDLGKKMFAFSRMDVECRRLLDLLEE